VSASLFNTILMEDKNLIYNNNNGSSWIVWLVVIGAVGMLAIMGIHGWSERVPYNIQTQTDEFKKSVYVKVLAKLEKGPYLHRVIDKDLKKICYVNAVGGGIECFDYDRATFHMTEEEKEKLTKRHRKPRSYRQNYHYSGTQKQTVFNPDTQTWEYPEDDDHRP